MTQNRAVLHVGAASFPRPVGLSVNMMPIITGDASSVPELLHPYLPLIEQTGLAHGSVSYLTVHESWVMPGQTQRRPGVHTDGTAIYCWGGGWGGGSPQPVPPRPAPKPAPKPTKGIYMASSDGRCLVWDTTMYEVDAHGSVLGALDVEPEPMEPGAMYWMTDRTPHESLPSLEHHHRQFFRLVADEIGIWYAQHSTANPLGVRPNAPIELGSKFDGKAKS